MAGVRPYAKQMFPKTQLRQRRYLSSTHHFDQGKPQETKFTEFLFIALNSPALILRDPAKALRLDHPALLRAALWAFAPTFLLDRMTSSGLGLAQGGFKFFTELLPGQLTISRLGTFALHAHLDPRRSMAEADRRGSLVDFLAARPRSTHKFFLYVGGDDAQAVEALLDLRWQIHLVSFLP